MSELKEKTDTIEIPKGAGVDGLLHALKEVLTKRLRVQKVEIGAGGLLTYKHFVKEEDPAHLEIDFSELLPYGVIRNSTVYELPDPHPNAALAITQLFHLAANEQLFPVVFVTGVQTALWSWFERTTGLALPRARGSAQEQLYGIPLLQDRQIEDQVLVLCAAYGHTTSLLDTRCAYKIALPLLPVGTP